MSRMLLLLLSGTFVVVLASALVLTQRIAVFPRRASELVASLEETAALNLRIRDGIEEQLAVVRRQLGLEALSPALEERFVAIHYELGEVQTSYLKLRIELEERLAVERIKNVQAELGYRAQRIFEGFRRGERPDAARSIEALEELAAKIEADFRLLSELQLRSLRQVLERLDQTVERGQLSLASLAALVALVLIVFAALLRRRILRPLTAILEASRRLRKGDFDVRAPVERDDEIGRLAQGFNYMAESLRDSHADLERRVEERTRQLEELQSQLVEAAKMSALGQLVSGVAHELNNPLTVIMGTAELARDQLATEGREEDRRSFESILSEAERCRKIVTGLSQFARPQAPELEEVRINDVVERVVQLREYQLATHNVRLERDYDATGPTLVGDPHKLEQVVLNLFNNACDAIEDRAGSGRIWVRTRVEEGAVKLVVADDGPGIEEPERVFEPFYTTKEVGRGMGMGLAVCYGIVRDHGGEIRAENWEEGARVTVTLPRQEAPQASAVPASNGQLPDFPAGTEALVVEDEELLLELQSAFLEDAGIRVHAAASGEEAIRLLEERAVTLVVSDVRMPGRVDGVGLYRWVETNRPELCERFLFVSGDALGSEVRSLIEEREVPCLHKPFTFDAYSEAVRRLLAAEEGRP